MSSFWKNMGGGGHFDKKGGMGILTGILLGGGAGGGGRRSGGGKSAEDWHNEDLAAERAQERRSRERKDVLTDINENPHVASYEDKPGGGVKITTRARKEPAKRTTTAKKTTAAKKPAAGTPTGTVARKSKQLENVTPKDNTKIASSGKVGGDFKPLKTNIGGPKYPRTK